MAVPEPSHLPVGLVSTYSAKGMKAWRVSRDVADVRNDRPDLIDPVYRQLT